MATDPVVKIEVPVKQVSSHLVTCIESGYSWFQWVTLMRDGDGYLSGEFALLDDSFAVALGTAPEARDRVLRAGKFRQRPVRWANFNGPRDYPVFRFTHGAFVEGLGRCMAKGYGRGSLAQIAYHGDGDWDIDAGGADLIVQLWLFDDVVFG